MKSEQKEPEEFEADIDSVEPTEDELELEVWDSTSDDEEGGLTLDEEIGGYNEGVEDKLNKFSPEY